MQEREILEVEQGTSSSENIDGVYTLSITGEDLDAAVVQVEENKTNIEALQASVSTLNSDVNEVKTSITGINSSITTINGQINTLNSTVGNEGSLTKVVTTLQGAVGDIGTRLADVEESVAEENEFEGRVDTLEERLNKFNSSTQNIETYINGELETLATVKGEVERLDGRLDVIDQAETGRLDKINETLEKLGQNIDELPTEEYVDGEIKRVEDKVNALDNTVNGEGQNIYSGLNYKTSRMYADYYGPDGNAGFQAKTINQLSSINDDVYGPINPETNERENGIKQRLNEFNDTKNTLETEFEKIRLTIDEKPWESYTGEVIEQYYTQAEINNKISQALSLRTETLANYAIDCNQSNLYATNSLVVDAKGKVHGFQVIIGLDTNHEIYIPIESIEDIKDLSISNDVKIIEIQKSYNLINKYFKPFYSFKFEVLHKSGVGRIRFYVQAYTSASPLYLESSSNSYVN